ncbi:MAG: serine--tRNA ligase [DPANN group archaeon]|nr:serine--tRNA ligase [DPANN group archaeon]
MLDIELFRKNPDVVKASQKKRGQPTELVEEVTRLDEKWREYLQQAEKLKHERNIISESINKLKKAGKSADAEIKQMKDFVENLKKIDQKAQTTKMMRDKVLLEIPNLIEKDVPLGKDETENKEIKKVGKIPKFKFAPKDHQDLLVALDCLDTEQAAKVAGARFYYLKSHIVRLNHALMDFAMDFLGKKGFTFIQPPYMLNKAAVSGAVHISAFEDAIYKIQDEDLYLIATAEHPIAAYLRDKTIDGKKLPMHFAGISPCFRKEAGTHGKDTKGIIRVHQFEKIEQFSFCRAEQAEKEFGFLLKNLEEIFKALEIPYRLIILCSGDTGKKDAKTIDLAGWFPSQNQYRELASCSILRDYQGRRSNIKYSWDGKTQFMHTLNNTAIATERTMACLVENFQQADGSIKIPKVLWKYCGFREIKNK